MPRIHQKMEEYAVADFQTEIRKRQGACNVMSVRSLAEKTGMPHTTLNPKLHDPDRFTVAELRKLIRAICPDPVTVLLLLGYSRREIKKIGGIENERSNCTG